METILPRKPVRRGQQMEMETTCQGCAFRVVDVSRVRSGADSLQGMRGSTDGDGRMGFAFAPHYRISVRSVASSRGRNKPLFSNAVHYDLE